MKDVILVIFIVALIICLLISLLLIFLLIKNENTTKNHLKIIDAINDYQNGCIKNGAYDEILDVTFTDREDHNKTLYRIWDWGYTRILPKDKFEIIKPYIK